MSATLQVDMANFRRAVDLALANSSRELSVATNARMYHLLQKAMLYTKRASREAIEKVTSSYSFHYYTRKGTLSKRARLVASGRTMSFIRIMQKRNPHFIRTHYKTRDEVSDAAEAWATSKKSSIGFMASVWVKAVRRFDRYAQQKAARQNDAERNVRKQENVRARGKVASPGMNPLAEASILVGADQQGTPLRDYGQRVLNDALRQAMASETAEIMRHLERKAKDACRAAGMEVRG